MRIITHHATPGTYKMSDLKNGMTLGQASGINIKMEIIDDGYYVDGARILGSVDASNGVVHVIDAVLLPE